jgi:hypothetical protein
MDSMSAFAIGEMNRGKELMVFDWEKAAELIAERKPTKVSAGLAGDWEWTGGEIWEDGKPVTDSYTYLASTWATPELDIDGEIVECYRMQSATPGWDVGEGWGSDTKWPACALVIVGADAPAAE